MSIVQICNEAGLPGERLLQVGVGVGVGWLSEFMPEGRFKPDSERTDLPLRLGATTLDQLKTL